MDKSKEKRRQQSLIKVDKAIAELPLLPSAVCNLMALSTSDKNFFKKVQQYAKQDPTFAVRIIKVANSAASAPLKEITTIKHAVTRIGTLQIKALATAMAVTKIFVPSNKSERDLWEHSIQVAVAAQKIANLSPRNNIDSEIAYLCGLLHDIGRFVLFNLVPDGPVKIDEGEWDTPEELIETEKQVTGTDHAALGAYAAKKWSLPSELASVISNHHNYEFAQNSEVDGDLGTLVRIVQIADFLSVLLMTKPETLTLPEEEMEKLIAKRCFHSSWDNPPIKANVLQKEVLNIYNESVNMMENLAINIEEE